MARTWPELRDEAKRLLDRKKVYNQIIGLGDEPKRITIQRDTGCLGLRVLYPGATAYTPSRGVYIAFIWLPLVRRPYLIEALTVAAGNARYLELKTGWQQRRTPAGLFRLSLAESGSALSWGTTFDRDFLDDVLAQARLMPRPHLAATD